MRTMKTQIIWTGKGNYQFQKGGEYDETRYPAVVRRLPHYYISTTLYCESVADVVKLFHLRYWGVA